MAEEKKPETVKKFRFSRLWCSELGAFKPGDEIALSADIAKSLAKEGMGEIL